MSDPGGVVRTFRGVSAADRVQQRRAALLDAGLSVLADGSRASVTIDDVSARAGLSKRYFYENFSTRNDLFVALGDRLVQEVTDAARAALEMSAADVLARLHDVVEAVVSVLINDPRNARLFLDLMGGQERGDTVGRAEHVIAKMLVDALVADEQVSGGERTRLDMAALILIAGGAQAVSDWLDGTIDLTRAELLEEIVRLMSAGFGAVRARSRD